jgi:hypothetical protein
MTQSMSSSSLSFSTLAASTGINEGPRSNVLAGVAGAGRSKPTCPHLADCGDERNIHGAALYFLGQLTQRPGQPQSPPHLGAGRRGGRRCGRFAVEDEGPDGGRACGGPASVATMARTVAGRTRRPDLSHRPRRRRRCGRIGGGVVGDEAEAVALRRGMGWAL